MDAYYFMTTTISTVGYGDFKARLSSDPSYSSEMMYMILVTVAGLVLFSSVTDKIFQYKSMQTVEEIIQRKYKDTDNFF